MSSRGSDDASDANTFSFGVRLGVVFIVQSAFLSALAAFSLFAYITAIGRNTASLTAIYDLVFADVQPSGPSKHTMGIRGGMLIQIGDVGVALTSLVIAFQTFLVLVFRANPPHYVAVIVLAAIWTLIALMVGVNMGLHGKNRFYGDTQYWCWITESYPKERIATDYFWLWLAAALNLVFYLAIVLVLQGFVVVGRGRVSFRQIPKRQTSLVSSVASTESTSRRFVALQMLFYPLVYIITILPICIVRWLHYAGRSIPFPATAFAAILFFSSGLFNVCLFVYTRPKLLPRRERRRRSQLFEDATVAELGDIHEVKVLQNASFPVAAPTCLYASSERHSLALSPTDSSWGSPIEQTDTQAPPLPAQRYKSTSTPIHRRQTQLPISPSSMPTGSQSFTQLEEPSVPPKAYGYAV
ncbi:hypothetical protein PM082_002666 [Marasmius tenuissimus]|nr:hypothetical protein PM082_002666 [Marasmius tenuissimus]